MSNDKFRGATRETLIRQIDALNQAQAFRITQVQELTEESRRLREERDAAFRERSMLIVAIEALAIKVQETR